MIPTNKQGESLPILTPKMAGLIIVDGTSGNAVSSALEAGIYRIAVQSSVSDAGVHICITTAGTAATVTNGFFMGNGAIEYMAIDAGSIIAVLNGKINVCPFS